MKCIIEYQDKSYYACISSHNSAKNMWVVLFTNKSRKITHKAFDLSMLEFNFAQSNQMSIMGFMRLADGMYKPETFTVTRMG